MRIYFLPAVILTSCLAIAGEPIKLCVAQPSGSESKNWKIQTSLAHRIESLALAKQLAISSPTLEASDEKHAKTEGRDRTCNYILLTTIEKSNQQFSGTFDPAPTGPPSASITSPVAQASMAPAVKYKIIVADGKKISSSTVNMPLKANPVPADYEEAGKKLIDTLAEQAINSLPK